MGLVLGRGGPPQEAPRGAPGRSWAPPASCLLRAAWPHASWSPSRPRVSSSSSRKLPACGRSGGSAWPSSPAEVGGDLEPCAPEGSPFASGSENAPEEEAFPCALSGDREAQSRVTACCLPVTAGSEATGHQQPRTTGRGHGRLCSHLVTTVNEGHTWGEIPLLGTPSTTR